MIGTGDTKEPNGGSELVATEVLEPTGRSEPIATEVLGDMVGHRDNRTGGKDP